MTERYIPWPYDPEVPEVREYDPALRVLNLGDGTVVFKPSGSFQVDGIEYDAWDVPNVIRPIAGLVLEHECREIDGPCGFEAGSDRFVERPTCTSEAYRWRPSMVYYRATEFSTPIYGA